MRDRIVGGGGFGGFGGGGGHSESAGFGVRVLHSGVWGFASSPLVTEDQVRDHRDGRRGREGERRAPSASTSS